jgi:hypothetical protein
MPPENTEQRKLAAIMFTDMVGYSALSQRDEKLAQELLEEHRQLLREIFPRFNGTEIKTIGDAFLVEFGSALEAAQCTIEIQRTLVRPVSPPSCYVLTVRGFPSFPFCSTRAVDTSLTLSPSKMVVFVRKRSQSVEVTTCARV